MKDRRQGKLKYTITIILFLTHCMIGIVHIIGPEQGFTVCPKNLLIIYVYLFPIPSFPASLVFVVILILPVSLFMPIIKL